MQDTFFIPSVKTNVQEFRTIGGGTNNATVWQKWEKPRGCTMAHLWVMGAGGSGGAGLSANQGAGSGGCGGMESLLIPLIFLPDSLYISVGAGGIGSNSIPTQIPGGATQISIGGYPTATIANMYLQANTVLAAAGGTGGTSAGNGGSGGSSLGSVPIFAAYGIYLAGQTSNGTNGGASVSGTSSFSSASHTCAGTGGAGAVGTTGGNIQSSGQTLITGFIPFTPGGILNGNPGYTIRNPFMSWGGTGGGVTINGNGNGGNGGIGCGGGGAGYVSGTPSYGGNGGDGIAIITVW